MTKFCAFQTVKTNPVHVWRGHGSPGHLLDPPLNWIACYQPCQSTEGTNRHSKVWWWYLFGSMTKRLVLIVWMIRDRPSSAQLHTSQKLHAACKCCLWGRVFSVKHTKYYDYHHQHLHRHHHYYYSQTLFYQLTFYAHQN